MAIRVNVDRGVDIDGVHYRLGDPIDDAAGDAVMELLEKGFLVEESTPPSASSTKSGEAEE
jgi:hypothetical protein